MIESKFETLNIVDVDDWNNLVINTYGKPYSLQQQNGCYDKCILRINIDKIYIPDDFYKGKVIPDEINGDNMGVDFQLWQNRSVSEWKGDPEENDKWYIELFWERNFYPDLNILANDLYNKGLLPFNSFSIEIDW